jgi:hypothetical protein
VELIIAEGVRVGQINVSTGVKRLRVTGGQVTHVWCAHADTADQVAEDLLFDGVYVASLTGAPDRTVGGAYTAFNIRGRRMAVVNCRVDAEFYCIYCASRSGLPVEGLIVAGCVTRTFGLEANVRLVGVERAVLVENTLYSPRKHNYRIHGKSDLHYAGHNVFHGAGMMQGTMDGDRIGRTWFIGNAYNHRLQVERTQQITVRDNRGEAGDWDPANFAASARRGAEVADVAGNRFVKAAPMTPEIEEAQSSVFSLRHQGAIDPAVLEVLAALAQGRRPPFLEEPGMLRREPHAERR